VVRHIRWQVALIFVGVILLGGLMVYLAEAYSVEQEPAPGGTYVEGMVGSPQYVNPLLCQYNDVDRDLCTLVFSGLLRLDERGELLPDLADSWEVSPDGLVYTFRLRPNARWHDNRPVTAEDVIFTIGLLQDPNFPGLQDVAALWRTVKAEEVNSLTVQFTLQEPYTPFLQYLTTGNFGVLPKHVLGEVQAADLPTLPFNRKPIGSGPFQVEQFGSGETGQPQHVLLSAFPAYYGNQPYIAKVDFKFYPDYASMLAAYRAGEIQGLSKVPADQLASVRDTPSMNLYTGPLSNYTMIFLNQGDAALPFFQDQNVRQALLLSLDRRQIIEEVLHGQGLIADSPLIPGTWAYASDLPPVVPNRDRARQLLNEAGWRYPVAQLPVRGQGDEVFLPPTPVAVVGPNDTPIRVKDGTPISFTLYTNNNPLQVALAQAVAKQWLEIGVQAGVVPVQTGLRNNYLEPRTYQAALIDVQLPSDPDPYPFWHETQADPPGQNYSQFRDRDLSEVLEQARRTNDQAQRVSLYHRFQEMFREQTPGILLYYPVYNYGISEKVRDVQIGPIAVSSDRFRTLPEWYVITRRVIANKGPVEAQ
jgi:peptide/nickel transport system substrate-binding protein